MNMNLCVKLFLFWGLESTGQAGGWYLSLSFFKLFLFPAREHMENRITFKVADVGSVLSVHMAGCLRSELRFPVTPGL